MMQVEAVVKMLQRTLTSAESPRSGATRASHGSSTGRCSGVRWTSSGEMTAREIAEPLAACGSGVDGVGQGVPVRWKLKEAALSWRPL